MARKKIPTVPPKKPASSRLAKVSRPQEPRVAHARLVHGFLVRPVAKAIAPARLSVKATIPAAANDSVDNARAHRSPNARLEGPPDDATFH